MVIHGKFFYMHVPVNHYLLLILLLLLLLCTDLLYQTVVYHLAPVCQKLAVIGFFRRFGPQWVFPSIQGAVEFAKSGEKVVSKQQLYALSYSWYFPFAKC